MEQYLPLIGIPIFFIVFFVLFRYVFPKLSGWGKLAEHYGTDQKASNVMGERIHFGEIKIGYLNMKNMVKGYKTDQGLFLSQYAFFSGKQPNLLIPWRAFQQPEQRNFLFIKRVRLPIGSPVITQLEMSERIYRNFSDRLPKRFNA